METDMEKIRKMMRDTQALLEKYPERRNCIMRNLSAKSKTYHEIRKWETFFDAPPANVRLDGSFGETIQHVPTKSADLVFMNFVLTKSTADYGKILSQAYRITRLGGIIAFCDNFIDEEKLIYEKFIGTCVSPVEWEVRDGKIYGLLRKN